MLLDVGAQMGDLLERRAKHDSAIASYNKAIALRPDKSMMYSNRGSAHYAMGHYNEAIADYTKAIDFSPQLDYRFHLNRCVVLTKSDHVEQAMKDLVILKTCCQNIIPADLEARITDKWQLIMQGMNLRVAADPKNPQLFYQRANLLFTCGWQKEGLADLQMACALEPGNKQYKQALKARAPKN